jgi:hypothetical protein
MKHRFKSLTRNQTVTFVVFFILGIVAIAEGVPPLIDWWQAHHREPVAGLPQPGSPPVVTTDPKDPHTHRVQITMPKEGWVSAWGSGPPNIMWMKLNATDVGPAKGHVYLLLICRVDDPTTDAMRDTRIEISQPFEPSPVAGQIAMVASESFLSRLIPAKQVWMSLVIMPSVTQPSEIHVLGDVERLKGSILITNSVLVESKSLKGNKNKHVFDSPKTT